MVNQGAQLVLRGAQSGRIQEPITVVDTAGSAVQFDDLGSETVVSFDEDVQILDVIGEGTTAPANLNTLELNVNGSSARKRADIAAMYDVDAGKTRRTQGLAGTVIKAGANIQLIGRA